MPITVLVTHADGHITRLGADEPDAAWVPFGITWTSQIPGGWKDAGFSLRQRIDQEPIPLRLLDEVEFVDEYGQTMYEGRIVKLPRQQGDDYMVGVECLGWASVLSDNTGFREIYRDIDLSRWGGAPLARKIASNAAYAVNDPSTGTGTVPAVRTGFVGPWGVSPSRPMSEGWYDSGGVPIGSLYYAWQRNANVNNADTNWIWVAFLATDDAGVSIDITANLRAAGPGSGTLAATTTDRRYAVVDLQYASVAVSSQAEYAIDWTSLAVYGNHGLTLRGTEPDAGFYIDDMIANAISRGAPNLNYTTGPGGSIEAPGIVVSQADYRDAMSVEPVILDLNKYVLWDWGVYENRTFFYRPTDPDRLTWQARLSDGVHLSLEGDDAEDAINGMVVKYTDPSGTSKIAGPTGSGFDTESSLLKDTSADNTVNAHGYSRRWGSVQVSNPLGDASYAETIGAAYLYQAMLPSRSGDITLGPTVEHPTKGSRPSREVKAGDWVSVPDHVDGIPRRIVSVRHTVDDGQTVVSVGNKIDKVGALLEGLDTVTKAKLG